MSRTDGVSDSTRSRRQDTTPGISKEDARAVAKSLHEIEERYMKALRDRSPDAEALGVEYNRALRGYEATQRLLNAAHDALMRVIQNIGR